MSKDDVIHKARSTCYTALSGPSHS